MLHLHPINLRPVQNNPDKGVASSIGPRVCSDVKNAGVHTQTSLETLAVDLMHLGEITSHLSTVGKDRPHCREGPGEHLRELEHNLVFQLARSNV